MSTRKKLNLLKELCRQYGLHVVNFTTVHYFTYAYVVSCHDEGSYIDKLSPDQLRHMNPGQIEEFVLECALTDMALDREED